jgi:hypothetical protein
MKAAAGLSICLALSLTYRLPGVAAEQPQTGTTAGGQVSPTSGAELHFVSVLTLRGEVVAVDPAKLLITVKSDEGRYSNLEARREQDLQGLKVGDRISVRYFEGAQIRERMHGEAAPAFSLKDGIMGATLIGGPSRKKHEIVAAVEKVDVANQEVTVRAPDGSLETVMVTNPEYLEHVKVGDRLGMTRVQALALSVKKES